jgi:Pyridoxamine 5'-phosphate oxidase
LSDQISATEAYKDALTKGDDDSLAAVAEILADDVVVLTNFGKADNKEGAIGLLKNPMVSGLLTGATWAEPTVDGDTVTVTATTPPAMPVGGLESILTFHGNKIVRVEQQALPAPALTPSVLRLTDDIKTAVNGALDNQTPILVAYSDDDETIHLSFRGTVQAYSDDQLALWARTSEGGLPKNIGAHPQVTLFYQDPKTRATYTFYGRARIASDEAARTTIFDNSNPREQNWDFRRHGVAIVVDLDKVEGRGPAGRVLMVRS